MLYLHIKITKKLEKKMRYKGQPQLKNDKITSNYSDRAKREQQRREQLKRKRTRIGKYEIPMYAMIDR